MTLAISRIIDIEKGSLILNGKDTKFMSIKELRNRLSVIP